MGLADVQIELLLGNPVEELQIDTSLLECLIFYMRTRTQGKTTFESTTPFLILFLFLFRNPKYLQKNFVLRPAFS